MLERSQPDGSPTAGRVVLPDLLRPGLEVVFCGTAAGKDSAAAGVYYAGRGNRFWSILADAGFTDRVLAPDAFGCLLGYGIGLTDLAKAAWGRDRDLPGSAFDVVGLERRIRAAAPRALAFNGKRAAQVFLGRPHRHPLRYGCQIERIGSTSIWVLPSTSAANRHWSTRPWRELAKALLTQAIPVGNSWRRRGISGEGA